MEPQRPVGRHEGTANQLKDVCICKYVSSSELCVLWFKSNPHYEYHCVYYEYHCVHYEYHCGTMNIIKVGTPTETRALLVRVQLHN